MRNAIPSSKRAPRPCRGECRYPRWHRRAPRCMQSMRRASYGGQLIERLSLDLTGQFDRGFSRQNLQRMHSFSLADRFARQRLANLPGR